MKRRKDLDITTISYRALDPEVLKAAKQPVTRENVGDSAIDYDCMECGAESCDGCPNQHKYKS